MNKLIRMHFIGNIKTGLLLAVPFIAVFVLLNAIISLVAEIIPESLPSFLGSSILYCILILYFFGVVGKSLNKFFNWFQRASDLFAILLNELHKWFLDRPLFGNIYRLFVILLGLDNEHGHGVFSRAVYVPSGDSSTEIGFVTQEDNDRLTVFVPGSPIPTSGKVISIDRDKCTDLIGVSVEDAMKTVVTMGKLKVPQD